ncbi:M48 family metalloprotease [Flaviaesturariibacter terrae]
MKQFLAPVLALLLPVLAGAQEYRFACFYGETANPDALCLRMRSFSATPSGDAADAVRNILRPIGLAPNFVLVPCDNIQNAAAVTLDDGFRYIVYDRSFMDAIAHRAQTAWSSTAILAHEIGHHLQGHTTTGSNSSLAQRRRQELEADEFSGFVLQKLGASLEQAQAAMQQLPEPEDESRSDHPLRWRRLAAIKAGYDRAASNEPATSPQEPAPSTPSGGPSREEPSTTHSGLERHDILSGTEFPSLRAAWDAGFQMSEAVWARGNWYVFLKKSEESGNQSYRVRNAFPSADIRELWDKKKNVTSINFYNNQWVLVMGEQAGNPNQRWRKRAAWPAEEIRQSWNEGYYISDVTYGDGEYVVLFNDKASIGYSDQQYHSSKAFPEDKIRELWADGYRINVLKFLNGEWILVMTKYRGSESVTQRWNTGDSFPLDALLRNEGDGFSLRSAAFDGTSWAIVMDK